MATRRRSVIGAGQEGLTIGGVAGFIVEAAGLAVGRDAVAQNVAQMRGRTIQFGVARLNDGPPAARDCEPRCSECARGEAPPLTVSQPVASRPRRPTDGLVDLIEHITGIRQGLGSVGVVDASELGFEVAVGHGVLHEPDGMSSIWSPQWYLQYGDEKLSEFAPFLDDVTSTSRCVTSILINN